MFENELQSLAKISENIKHTQKNIVKHSVNDTLIDVQRKAFNNQNLTIREQVEGVGGSWQLFLGFMILMLPIFFVLEKLGAIFWLIVIFLGSCFYVFPSLHVYIRASNSRKLTNINWYLFFLMTGLTLLPALGLIFGIIFWYILGIGWGLFLLWCVVSLNIEAKMENMMTTFQINLQELQQIHTATIFDMSLDFYSPTIYPQQVIKIRDSIERVTSQIQQLLELQHRISNYYQRWFATFWSVFFSKKLKEQMQSFFRNESNQLLIYVNTFSQDLNFWTERHKMELSQLEENIDQQKEETILPEGKLALELSQDRISRLTQEADMIRAAQK